VRALRIGAFLTLMLAVLLGVWFIFVSSPQNEHEPAAETDMANATTFSKILAAESFTLANGLQVAVIPDPKSAEIFHMVWYKVGAADDPPGKSGLAHFVEHLTFGGTQTFTEREFTRTLKHVGDKQDAFTTRDQTVYYQMVPPKHLATVMQLEADRMSNVVVTEESMASEREEVLEERQEMDRDPRALLDYRMHTVLYRDHPYGIPGLGWPQEMDSITPEEAIAFYRLWYAPNNAIVLVYGDITAEEVKPLIEKYYGGIPARAIPARRMPSDVMPKEAQSVVINDDRASESIWRRSYLAPSYTAGATEHTYALQVLAEVLGGGPESRLHQSLVVKKALAQKVGVDYEPDSVGLTTFSIHVIFSPGADLDEVAKAVDLELQALIADGPSSSEVVRAQQHTKAETAFFEDNIPGAAQLIGNALTSGQTLEDLKAWSERIAAVTIEQVREAARAVFLSDRSVTGILLPELSK
jgi:zinc protease